MQNINFSLGFAILLLRKCCDVMRKTDGKELQMQPRKVNNTIKS